MACRMTSVFFLFIFRFWSGDNGFFFFFFTSNKFSWIILSTTKINQLHYEMFLCALLKCVRKLTCSVCSFVHVLNQFSLHIGTFYASFCFHFLGIKCSESSSFLSLMWIRHFFTNLFRDVLPWIQPLSYKLTWPPNSCLPHLLTQSLTHSLTHSPTHSTDRLVTCFLAHCSISSWEKGMAEGEREEEREETRRRQSLWPANLLNTIYCRWCGCCCFCSRLYLC